MKNILRFPSLIDIPQCLRNIADEIEAGDVVLTNGLTMVSGDQLFHLGTNDDNKAIKEAIVNLTVGQRSALTRFVDSE